MLYREIIAVCSQIHTKHINTLCGQNVELPIAKPGGTKAYSPPGQGSQTRSSTVHHVRPSH